MPGRSIKVSPTTGNGMESDPRERNASTSLPGIGSTETSKRLVFLTSVHPVSGRARLRTAIAAGMVNMM